MKLTKAKLIETLRKKNQGWTTYQARKIAGISIRRVNQVWGEYLETGKIPEIGKNNGRPPRAVEEWEIQMVKQAYEKYRVSASTLTRLIERDYGEHINHNRIHRILLDVGYAKKKDTKDIRKKKWKLYERRHSLTAVHLDWFYDAHKEQWVLPVIDDASRYLLSLVETSNATTDASIRGMEEALQHGKIQQCITDHGTQFTDPKGGSSRFSSFWIVLCLKLPKLKIAF